MQKSQIYENNMGKNFNISGHEFLKYKISVTLNMRVKIKRQLVIF